ncbi:MAG TPA: CBS domain-containing protein [Thermoleophilaceae bacterium]
MQIAEAMTDTVVTAPRDASMQSVAELMRDREVGSVVIVDGERPCAMITDRDVAIAVGANGVDPADEVDSHASRPLVCGELQMNLEEAAALMVQHRVRRLPIVDDGSLAGIVTLDDLAVKAGDLKLAQQMTADVARAALPEFFFHQRGG